MTTEQDFKSALDFLHWLRPDGPWLLVAIPPDGSPISTTTPTAREAEAFIRQHNGKRNLYFSVNPTRTALNKKASKIDIAAIEYILGDLDPNDDETPEQAKQRYLDQLKLFKPEASALIDSGNGLQGLWKLQSGIELAKPIETDDGKGNIIERSFSSQDQATIDQVEASSALLMERLGGKAGTQNIDRVLRLPGTTNLPNAAKRKRGRVPCQAKLLWCNGATCALADFPVPEQKTKDSKDSNKKTAKDKAKSLPDHLTSQLCIKGCGSYATRSELFWAFFNGALRNGVDERTIVGACLESTYAGNGIFEHIRENGGKAYIKRQIAHARQEMANQPTAEINRNHALVLVGDKAAVMKLEDDGTFSLLQVGAFKQWFANRQVRVGRKMISVADLWLNHPQRREYQGIEFAPTVPRLGYYNLWRGFAVEPRTGDCSKFLAHLHNNVCQGNEYIYNWVVGWHAQIIQQPAQKPGTALVLRGKQGVGKTKVGEVFGAVIGHHHYALVSDPRYVTGRFNSHMVSLLLLHADEAFWAGDKNAEGKLKDLVTGKEHFIEFKNKEPIRINNYIRLFVTGNPDWMIPAGFEERRFAVLDVGEDHMQDHAYFAAIDAEMNNGGREALLHHLLNFDLSKVNLREIPKTSGLLEQKIESMTGEQGWWFDTLKKGQLPSRPTDGVNTCLKDRLFYCYITHARLQDVRRRAIETMLGMFLSKYVGSGLISTKVDGQPAYRFPSLKGCRDFFAKQMGQELGWDGEDDPQWQHEPGPWNDEASLPY